MAEHETETRHEYVLAEEAALKRFLEKRLRPGNKFQVKFTLAAGFTGMVYSGGWRKIGGMTKCPTIDELVAFVIRKCESTNDTAWAALARTTRPSPRHKRGLRIYFRTAGEAGQITGFGMKPVWVKVDPSGRAIPPAQETASSERTTAQDVGRMALAAASDTRHLGASALSGSVQLVAVNT